MKSAEIRELTNKEIAERIDTFQDQLLKLKLSHAISPLENPMRLTNTRRTIARMKTILSERSKQNQQS